MIITYNKKNYFIFTTKFYLKKTIKFYYVLLFVFAYVLYIFSLEKCYKGFDFCSTQQKWIKRKILDGLISNFIIVILIELIFYNFISSLNIVHLIVFYIAIYIYSNGIDFEDHGFYNFIGSILIIIILLFIISPLNCLLYLIRKNNKIYIFIFIFISIILMIIYLYFSNYYLNCNDWKFGLNNTFIENDILKYGCKIKFPKTCPYKIVKYFSGEPQNNPTICDEKTNTKKKLLENFNNKYINSKTKRFGYPLPNKIHKIHEPISIFSDDVMNIFKDNLVDVDNHSLIEKIYNNTYPEIIIDYNKNPFGELLINLQFNKTLSDHRKLLEKNTTPYSENIIIIFIDSVSRAYSIRSLKKTLKFVEKFMRFKGSHNHNFPSENFHSFQFFKYHAFDRYTRFNYPPVFYGRVNGKLVRNIKFLKENGYVTCYINDMCLSEPTNTGHKMSDDELSDHEMLICDPNMKHIFSSSKRCLYNKITASYAFEYGEQFLKKYPENRKYLHIVKSNYIFNIIQ